MSAWYVFSALGFYPLCPGSNQFVWGSPLFDEALLTFENGKTLMIKAQDNQPDHVFVNQLPLNGERLTSRWVSNGELVEGGQIEFLMTDPPDKKRRQEERRGGEECLGQ